MPCLVLGCRLGSQPQPFSASHAEWLWGEVEKRLRWCWKPPEQGFLELIYCHLQLVIPADLRGCFEVAFISVCKKLRCFSSTAVEKYRMKFVRDFNALSKMCKLMENRSLFSHGFAHFSPSIHLLPLHCKHHPVCDTPGGPTWPPWLACPARGGVTLGTLCLLLPGHWFLPLWFLWHF